MKRFPWTGLLSVLFLCEGLIAASAAPGRLQWTLRDRVASDGDEGEFIVRHRPETWRADETAVIVCDMWDLHHCKNAVRRVNELAPRMNEVVKAARDAGSLIIHAPSSCMDAYAGHPARKRAQDAPAAKNAPETIGQWCSRIPEEDQGVYPVDQSDGGEDDDPQEHEEWAKYLAAIGRNPRSPWKKQVDAIEIKDQDAITDSGVETWNLMEAYGIENVVLVGVHLNMCVLGRPFGLRQMAANGKNVVLMRDMTDSMYNPNMWPYVDHYTGTRLVVEHVEKYVCPSVTSDQILGGRPFVFSGDPIRGGGGAR